MVLLWRAAALIAHAINVEWPIVPASSQLQRLQDSIPLLEALVVFSNGRVASLRPEEWVVVCLVGMDVDLYPTLTTADMYANPRNFGAVLF